MESPENDKMAYNIGFDPGPGELMKLMVEPKFPPMLLFGNSWESPLLSVGLYPFFDVQFWWI